jgi:TP901 family phage tail tape measure protein
VGFSDKATAGLKKVGGQFSKTSSSITGKVSSMGKSIVGLAAKFTMLAGVAGIAAVGIAVGKSVSAFADFEDAMAGVKKTTGMSDEAIKSLGEGIKGLAGTIPLAHTELADIAAVAGQLGIQEKDAILEFTKTAAEMATAFDMPAEKAATVAAKLTNIYGLGIEKASNLASAINALGNTTAASESQISDYAMSLGASAVNMGFSSTEAVAMGASLISMGMDASDAGTRLNSAFTAMGKKVEDVSEFLGMYPDTFFNFFRLSLKMAETSHT